MQVPFFNPSINKNNWRITGYIFCFVLLIFQLSVEPCLAQKTISSTQLLANQPNLNLLLEGNLQFLKENKQGLPLIDKMEFRTETDELDINRQEFLFRMSFNNNKARKLQDKLTNNKIRYYELQNLLLDESKLADRYEQIIEWHYAQKELEHLKEKKLILEDKKKIYQKSLDNTLKVDIDNLLKTEQDLQDLNRSILKLEFRKNHTIQQLISKKDSSNYLLSSENWISIEIIQDVLDKTEAMPKYNLALALQDVEVDFAELGYSVEKAKTRKILDFVQIKYRGSEKLDFIREWSIGVGVNIPNKASHRAKLNKAQLNIFDENYKQDFLESEIDERLADYLSSFNSLVKEYLLVEQYISDNQLSETYNKYSAAGGVHPLTLLRIKESMLNNKLVLQKIEKAACLNFLEILKCKGLLSQTPAINYLSDDLHFF